MSCRSVRHTAKMQDLCFVTAYGSDLIKCPNRDPPKTPPIKPRQNVLSVSADDVQSCSREPLSPLARHAPGYRDRSRHPSVVPRPDRCCRDQNICHVPSGGC
jgi:hypothetical protein